MTPTRRLTIARVISAVTVSFGTAERIRSMRNGNSGNDGEGTDRPAKGPAFNPSVKSDLEAFDFIPQGAVLGFVGRPYLLLRHFAEFLDIGFDHGHAERLKLLLGSREIVDRLGRLADFFLRGARKIHHQLLLIGQ